MGAAIILSPKNREEYEKWRKKMKRKIEAIWEAYKIRKEVKEKDG